MVLNIAHQLSRVARAQFSSTGLIEAKTGKSFTFGELETISDIYAWKLKREGVAPGDRVMLMVKPSADFICLTFALFKVGAPVILIDPGMGYRNLLRCVAGVRPKVLIGIPKAHLFTRVFNSSFSSIEKRFCCGHSFGIFGENFTALSEINPKEFPIFTPKSEDLAAIIFTTGSTGPPKGVRYEHTIFAAQLEHIRNYYNISAEDIDQPAFPLFALFSTALGACAVIPDMDATKPAKVDPRKFLSSIVDNNVTYSFGSPALWDVVATYASTNSIRLTHLKKVLMAGAPVSGELLSKVKKILPVDAEIHTPYGATESLPIVSMEASEILASTWNLTMQGKGTCVGRPLPGIDVKVISISDDPITTLHRDMILKPQQIGEVIVCGDVVTRAYENNPEETTLSKLLDGDQLYHRMGDLGYIDEEGRLWFCGRKAHRVKSKWGDMFTIPCEAIINQHLQIKRSALVGVSSGADYQEPVMVLEKIKDSTSSEEKILAEVTEIASQSSLTRNIKKYLFHKKFPVDIRHNAKIFREKLAIWAAQELKKS